MTLFNPSAANIGALLLLILLLIFIAKLIQVRRRAKSLPGPPHHWLWGHIGIAVQMCKVIPADAFPNIYWQWISEKYGLQEAFYFDTWPLGPPLLIVLSADMADQMTVKHSLPKHPIVHSYLKRFLGSDNMVSANGEKWRGARHVFSSGFALCNIMESVPKLLDGVLEYRASMVEQAKIGGIFSIEEKAMRMAFGFIGQIALGENMSSQRENDQYLTTIRKQLEYMPKTIFYAAVEKLNFFNQLALSRNLQDLDDYLSARIDSKISQIFAPSYAQKQPDPSLLRIGLDNYFAGKAVQDSLAEQHIDPEFRKLMIDQLKVFMFAGYDASSTTISNIIYLLSKNTTAREHLRDEFQSVFGPDNPEIIADMIQQNPYILNELPYCIAAIKETLRIFPPAGTNRLGEKGFYLKNSRSDLLSTEGLLVWPAVYSMARNPEYYPEPDRFMPERFLPDESPFPAIPQSAFRPFERGPRSCMGKDIGMLNIKLSLIFTVRRFDFEEAYDKNAMRIDGHPCYQVMWGSAKPKSGMPMRVRLRGGLRVGS